MQPLIEEFRDLGIQESGDLEFEGILSILTAVAPLEGQQDASTNHSHTNIE
jgi:hypothetical protein